MSHITYIKYKCRKALQLLWVISSKDWGGDRTTLLRIYRSHIRAKLDCSFYLATYTIQNRRLFHYELSLKLPYW